MTDKEKQAIEWLREKRNQYHCDIEIYVDAANCEEHCNVLLDMILTYEK